MSESLIAAFKSQTNGAADGTGVIKLTEKAKQLLGGHIPQNLIDYSLSIQLSIFGDYPTSKDVAPSAIFTAVFAIFLIAHLYIFFKNYSRGHKFWLSLLFALYNLMRVIGWAMRIVWAKDILKMKVGLASSIFVITPIVVLASLNLVLAQRIFTWHHPHIGSTKLFWTGMITIYIIVSGVVTMAIVGAAIPYLYYLSEAHYRMCRQVGQAAAVLCVSYSLLAVNLVAGAFMLKPSQKALSTMTYQPWWIESFDVFYYVPKGAARRAEETFKTRDPDYLNHVRVIASTTETHDTIERVQSVTSKSGKLDHNYSIWIILLTSLTLLISSTFRCVSTFLAHKKAGQSWIFLPVIQYIMFGVLEVFVNLLYLLGRIDLRFYRPDKLSKSYTGSFESSSSHGSHEGFEKGEVAHGDDTLRGSNDKLVK